MAIRLLLGVLILGVTLSGNASAQLIIKPLPSPLPTITPVQVGQEHAGDCEEVYLNTFGGVGSVTAGGAEIADDLHTTLTQDSPLCALTFGYVLTSGSTDAVVTFYRNDGTDSGIGAVVAGPFGFLGLPGGGAFAIHAEVPSGMVGPDVWMGVRLTNTAAEPIVYPTPSIGASHDLLASGGVLYPSPFGGNPLGNLYLGVFASRPTGTQASTWGAVKAHYR